MAAQKRITQAMVDAIKASPLSLRFISQEIGLSKSTCSKIRNGHVFASKVRPPCAKKLPLAEQSEDQVFQTEEKTAAVRPDQIPAILHRVPASVFDLGRMA